MTCLNFFKARYLTFFIIFNFFTPVLLAQSFDWNQWPKVEAQYSPSSSESSLRTLRSAITTPLGELEIELHYPLYAQDWSVQVDDILREVAPKMVEKFDWLPKEAVHFVLKPEALVANGSAGTFPRNKITLNLQPPVGEAHLVSNPHFMRALVVHELAHILHMDQTRGFPKAVRSVFGAIGKWNGVVPRWFSEGIGVWAETYYTQGGRLKSRELEHELKNALSRPSFCQTLDCLDDPGVYPYGSLPYWMGAFFIQAIEKQKSGSITCLLKANSRSLPFFLDDAFKFCTGRSSHALFAQFLDQFKNAKQTSISSPFQKTISFQGSPLFQKGAVLLKNRFFVLEHVDEKEPITRLSVRDMTDNRVEKTWRFEWPIASLQAPGPLDQKEEKLIFATTDHAKEGSNQWWGLDTQSFKTQKIDWPGQAQYLYRVAPKIFLGLSFTRGAWEARLWDESQKNRALVKRWRFPLGADLQSPRVVEKKGGPTLVYQLNQKNSHELHELEVFSTQAPSVLWRSPKPWQLLLAQDGAVLIQQNNEIQSFGEETLALPKNLSEHVVDFWWQKGSGKEKGLAVMTSLADPSHLYRAILPTRVSTKTSKTKEFTNVKTEEKKFHENSKETSYFGLRHLAPHYWTFGFGGNEYLTRYDVATSLNDPLERHLLSLTGSYYPEISRSGGSGSYTFDPGLISTTVNAYRAYTVRGAARSTDKSEGYGLSFSSEARWMRLDYRASIFGRQEQTEDFISSRESLSYGLSQNVSYTGVFADSLVQRLNVMAQNFRQDTQGFSPFFGEHYKMETNFRLSSWMDFRLNGAFSELEKKGLRSGVLYGGGSQALYNLGGMHEFYGVEYGNIISNKIRSAKAEFSFEIGSPYSGSGYFPIFLKTTHLLLGTDYVRASNIFLEDRFLNEDELFSYYWGFSFKANAFYAIPVSLDLIFARVPNEEVGTQSRGLFLLRGDFFP